MFEGFGDDAVTSIGEVLGGVLVLSFEVKLDLNVVGVAKENLPTGAVGHLIHAVGHALVGKVPLHRLEAVAAELDMIDHA